MYCSPLYARLLFIWVPFVAALVALITLTGGRAHAGEPNNGPRRVESYPQQYQQSCGSGGWSIRAITIPTAGDIKCFKAEGISAATGQNQLIRFGEQVKISASAGNALVVESMALSATVAAPVTMAEGVGYSTVEGVAGTGRYGVMNAHRIVSGADATYFKISPEGWIPWSGTHASMNVTARRGRCTAVAGLAAIGGGCDSSTSDCGSGGTCSLALPPQGVYVCGTSDTNGGVIRMEICSQ